MAEVRGHDREIQREVPPTAGAAAFSPREHLQLAKDAGKSTPNTADHLLPSCEFYDSSAQPHSEALESIKHNRIDKPQLASIWSPHDKVLAVGDMHSTADIKKYFEENLPALHAAGAKAVGFEFLPRHLQKDVNQYCDLKNRQEKGEALNQKDRDKLDLLTKEVKDNLNPDSEGPAGQTQERLMTALDAIRRSGMKVLCVEPDINHPFDKGSGYSLLHEGMQALGPHNQGTFDKYLHSPSGGDGQNDAGGKLTDLLKGAGWDQAKITKFLATMDGAQKAGMNLGRVDQTNQQWASTVQNFRNESWAQVIESTPGRIAMFSGAGHFGYGDSGKAYDGKTLNERLKEHGIGTTVVQFASDKSPVGEGASVGQKYNDAANQLGLTKKQFAVKLNDRSRIADFVIHLPQDQ